MLLVWAGWWRPEGLLAATKLGFFEWHVVIFEVVTNTEIFDEKSGQFQAEFVATEPENLWWHVVKFKANTYSHLCLYVWDIQNDTVCDKKGNFFDKKSGYLQVCYGKWKHDIIVAKLGDFLNQDVAKKHDICDKKAEYLQPCLWN